MNINLKKLREKLDVTVGTRGRKAGSGRGFGLKFQDSGKVVVTLNAGLVGAENSVYLGTFDDLEAAESVGYRAVQLVRAGKV